MSDKKQLSYK